MSDVAALLSPEQIDLAIRFNDHQDFEEPLIADIQRVLQVPVTREWDKQTVVALAGWLRPRDQGADGMITGRALAALESAGLATPGVVSPLEAALDPQDLPGRLAEAVVEAEADWHGGASEADPSPQGRLAAIFRDCGWSRTGVDRQSNGHIYDWCGMAVCAWLVRVGLAQGLRSSTFYATRNVEDFFAYNRSPVNSRRTMTRVHVQGSDVRLRDYHQQRGGLRLWSSAATVRATNLDDLDIQAGDVVLINHSGATTGADHITMVRKWAAPVLETIEGNATGLNPAGETVGDAVIVKQRDLSDLAILHQIYGIGRVSRVDFEDLAYQP